MNTRRQLGTFLVAAIAVGIYTSTAIRVSGLGPNPTSRLERIVHDRYLSELGSVTVLVAMRDLPPGTVLTADDVFLIDLPPLFAPDDALRSRILRSPIRYDDHYIGRVVQHPILRNEMVRERRLR